MTSFAPVPNSDEIPAGFMHVGWYCTAQGPGQELPDGCLMPLSRADSEPRDGEVHLWDANHHASWAPVYVRLGDL